jgi:hypothetical protein
MSACFSTRRPAVVLPLPATLFVRGPLPHDKFVPSAMAIHENFF